MKQITKTLSMTGMFLFSGTLALMAEKETVITAYQSPITNLSSLTTGSKVVFFHQHPEGASRHYYLFDENGNIGVKANKPVENSAGSGAFAWTVTVTGENDSKTYTFQSNGTTKKYISFEGNNDKQLKDNAGTFTIQSANDGQNDHWKIKSSTENSWFNGNAINNGGFTTWNGGSPYEIIPVTVEEKEPTQMITLTIECKTTTGVTLSTTTEERAKGSTYTVSAPEKTFYTHTKTTVGDNEQAEGNITLNENTTVTYLYQWNMPFETSNISGEEFPANTKWYLLKLRDGFVKYDSNNASELPGKQNKSYEDAYWWAFSGDETQGITVYNKAAGTGKIMTAGNPSGNDSKTFVHFDEKTKVEVEESGLNSNWTITPSSKYSGENGFYLARKGESIKVNEQGGKLVFWAKDADQGSTFRVISAANEITALKNCIEPASKRGAVGGLKADKYQEFTNAIKEGGVTGLVNAKAISDKEENMIAFNDQMPYRFENLARKYSTKQTISVGNGGYLEFTDKLEKSVITVDFTAMDKDSKRANAVWTLEKSGENYKLKHANSGKYIGAAKESFATAVESNESKLFTFESLGSGQYKIKPTDGQPLHASGPSEANAAGIQFYNDGLNSPSAWYLIPATSITVSIGEAGYTTVNYPFAVTLPEGITAYYGTTVNQDNAIILQDAGKNIPANTPVVLQGEAKEYTLTISENVSEKNNENIFKGTLVAQAEAGNNDYVLASKEEGVGFYKLKADNYIPQNKAYYEATAANLIQMFSLDTDGEDGTTGIENVENVNSKPEVYYDLQGRRVMNPTKGIYVTESGKKVLFTK